MKLRGRFVIINFTFLRQCTMYRCWFPDNRRCPGRALPPSRRRSKLVRACGVSAKLCGDLSERWTESKVLTYGSADQGVPTEKRQHFQDLPKNDKRVILKLWDYSCHKAFTLQPLK
ncbi:unnamed protein product, partial [Nesidiocoris tenuis]